MKLQVSYTDLTGKQLPIHSLQQGADLVATITVENICPTDLTHLALTHILPSGWEVFNEPTGTPADHAAYSYRDVRDDRILTYFDLKRGERKQFSIRLQATYEGSFILPAIQCEAMYDTAIQARTSAGKTTVNR